MKSPCEQQDLHSIEQTIEFLTELLKFELKTETVDLLNAQQRILAEEISAKVDVPAWDNSAMDGYAFNSLDLIGKNALPVSGIMAAGDNPNQCILRGHCVRIYTGAPIPQGVDTVVPQENCLVDGERIIFDEFEIGQNIRKQGEETQQGAVLLSKGTRLRAQEVGLLASQGYGQIKVFKPLRVGVFSSGNELAIPGEPIRNGQIYDVNRYTLNALFKGWGLQVTHYPNLPDSLAATLASLDKASQEQDIIVTSGAVSVSEADHIKAAVEQLGKINLWRVAIQPGKPFAFGKIGSAAWIGLPGNPAASLITSCIMVRPALLKAQGLEAKEPTPMRFKALFNHKSKVRQQYLQARLVQSEGKTSVELHPKQSSAMLANASWADGLAVIPAFSAITEGDRVEFIPYTAFF
ncbi:MAG: gephyrin-like molybdotransferase Glp [Venatoribacter sp.]